MAYEIEMKAWVQNPEALKSRLEKRAQGIQPYHKRDTYYLAPVKVDGKRHQFRIRYTDDNVYLTLKDKEIKDGMEYNKEREIPLTYPADIEELIRRTGCTVRVAKEKKGIAYTMEHLTCELAEVVGLGWFLEIEKLVEGDSEKEKTSADGEIRTMFKKLEVPETDIETRYYTDMLLDKKGRQH